MFNSNVLEISILVLQSTHASKHRQERSYSRINLQITVLINKFSWCQIHAKGSIALVPKIVKLNCIVKRDLWCWSSWWDIVTHDSNRLVLEMKTFIHCFGDHLKAKSFQFSKKFAAVLQCNGCKTWSRTDRFSFKKLR